MAIIKMNTFKRRTIGETTVITLRVQNLDAANADQMTRRVNTIMNEGKPMVVDLGALRYFDIAGFAAILSWAAGGSRKTEVRLCSQSGAVRALFELLRADSIMPLYRTCEEALTSFDTGDSNGVAEAEPPNVRHFVAGQGIA